MLPICVRTERVWPKLPSIQGIRANLVYIVSLLNTAGRNSLVQLTLELEFLITFKTLHFLGEG